MTTEEVEIYRQIFRRAVEELFAEGKLDEEKAVQELKKNGFESGGKK